MLLSASAPVGCGTGETPAPAEAAGPLGVELRLEARDFGLADTPLHGEMAPIGDEARPVLVAPRATPVASLLGRKPDADGVVRATFELPEAVRDLPEAAFILDIQRMPGGVTPELLEPAARTTPRQSVREGWRLVRGAGRSASLVYRDADAVASHVYNLHLGALSPGPTRLESRAFEVPAGALLEIAYGLATAPGAAGRADVHFQATLACDEAPARDILDAVVGPGEGRWRDVSVVLPERGGRCRLALSSDARDGSAVRGAVWSVPRVLRPLPVEADATNLVLISLDTLRADHLSGFGYPRVTSPRIDAELIARGTTFDDVTSTFSRTDVSHMSVFTGLYPEARPEAGRLRAGTPVPLLAERLRAAGFETAAFTEDGLLAGVFGFWFGFDRFTERAYRHEEQGIATFAGGADYLRSHRDRRFFLFLHTYKTHAPYVAGAAHADLFRDPADWNRQGMSAIPESYRDQADEYDRTIREADDLVGGILDELERLGLAERTLVVLLSDHGEAFGEHGIAGHSFSGRQEVIHVPLVLRGPTVPAGLRVATPVSLVDVAPTLLDLLGLAPLSLHQGTSLVPALRGGALPDPRPLHFSWLADGAAGVRYGDFKYERSSTHRSLFRIDRDPHEEHPLGGRSRRPLAERLLADHAEASARIREGFLHPDAEAEPPAIPEDVERSLRALGYIE